MSIIKNKMIIWIVVLMTGVTVACDAEQEKSLLAYSYFRAAEIAACKVKSQNSNTGSIIWFGDSNSYRMDFSVGVPGADICNVGVPGYTTYDIINTYQSFMSVEHSKLFVMIGTNNLLRLGESTDKFMASYNAMIDCLKKFGFPIYCVAILPSKHGSFTVRINEANEAIKATCALRGLTFVETVGYDDSDFTLDGYHLNDTGRDKFYAQITAWLL